MNPRFREMGGFKGRPPPEAKFYRCVCGGGGGGLLWGIAQTKLYSKRLLSRLFSAVIVQCS